MKQHVKRSLEVENYGRVPGRHFDVLIKLLRTETSCTSENSKQFLRYFHLSKKMGVYYGVSMMSVCPWARLCISI
jgi:hypothetical protein